MSATVTSCPTVSVIMTVKNGGDLVCEAVNSILNQTFEDFEFIIINDGSTDDTLTILKKYQDPRIKLYTQENLGPARAANRGLAIATGKYIARQDHDDISLPTRLEKQVQYLELHGEVALLGTSAIIQSENESKNRYHDHPIDPKILKYELIYNNPFVHTSIMFRSNIIRHIGYYTPMTNYLHIHDYNYIVRISRKYKVSNLAERLVIYRESPSSLSSNLRDRYREQLFRDLLVMQTCENIHYYDASLSHILCLRYSKLYHGVDKLNISWSELKRFMFTDKKVLKKIIQNDCKVSVLNRDKESDFIHRAFYDPASADMIGKYLYAFYIFTIRTRLKVKENFWILGSNIKNLFKRIT